MAAEHGRTESDDVTGAESHPRDPHRCQAGRGQAERADQVACERIDSVPDIIHQSIQRLAAGGVRFDRGLSDEEISRVQDRLSFTFGPEHHEFLQSAMPVGESWPDWRNDPEDDLRARLAWPVDGVIFDVHNNGFWPASWGARPGGKDDREREARALMALR